MSYEPELRPGPPWIMEEMIWAQPELPAQIAGSEDADRLASHLRTAVDAGRPVLFTGCGTSEHAARAARAIVGDALPGAMLATVRISKAFGGLVAVNDISIAVAPRSIRILRRWTSAGHRNSSGDEASSARFNCNWHRRAI